MSSRHIISILVENHAGVLARVSGLFSRRGYNIEGLSVGVTENPEFSRITIAVIGDDYVLNQIKKQLAKLIVVKKVLELNQSKSVFRELILIKINAKRNDRLMIFEIANIFKAKIVDLSEDTIIIELTGEGSKIDAFTELLAPYGILEIARTGLTALERGSITINKHLTINEEE